MRIPLYFDKASSTQKLPQLTYPRGTGDNSGSFSIPSSLIPNFKIAARQQIPGNQTSGLVMHEMKSKQPRAEIFFKSTEICNDICKKGIKVGEKTFFGMPTYAPEYHFTEISFSNLPFLPNSELREGLIALCSSLGHIVEVGFMEQNGWFEGTGYAKIRSTEPVKSFKEINWPHHCKLNVTMSSVPVFCRYCHKNGHTKDQCKERPTYPCQFCQSNNSRKKQCVFCSQIDEEKEVKKERIEEEDEEREVEVEEDEDDDEEEGEKEGEDRTSGPEPEDGSRSLRVDISNDIMDVDVEK